MDIHSFWFLVSPSSISIKRKGEDKECGIGDTQIDGNKLAMHSRITFYDSLKRNP